MIDINDDLCVDAGSIILVEIEDRWDKVFVEIKGAGRRSVKIIHGETAMQAGARIRAAVEKALDHD